MSMNIIVTGCSSGIGAEIVKTFLNDGNHTVIGIARRGSELDKIKLLSDNSNAFIPIQFDLSNISEYQSLKSMILQYVPNIDILINNAGILTNKLFEKVTESEFDTVFNVNIKAPYFLIQSLLSLFASNSHIVNITSMGGVQGSVKFAGLSAYSASKAALSNLTESLAVELQERKIFVNAIALGAVQTEMLKMAFPDYKAPISPKQMADFIVSFAKTGHNFFNGKILPAAITTP